MKPFATALCCFLSCSILLLTACQKKDITPATPEYFSPAPNTVGTIAGKILYTGKKPLVKKVDMDGDPQCARLHTEAVTDANIALSGNALSNVFIYIKSGLEDKKFAVPANPVTIEQKGCWFGPRVLGIQVGQTLQVVNADPVTHNIHPLAQINREWNQSQEPGAAALTRKFSQPEVMIRVKCNIHGWMHAWVGVVAHPYFAVTETDGTFQLTNVPAGKYTIETWQETLGKQEQTITVTPAQTTELVFTYQGE